VSILEIPVEQGKPMGVRLGDGHHVATGGKCRGIEVLLGEFHTEVEAYMLELGNLDMILRVTWLQRFGKVTFDWEHMTISFYWKGEHVELQGQRVELPQKEKEANRRANNIIVQFDTRQYEGSST